MKIYYAHCVALYNTPQEKRDIEELELMGFTVVNPNTVEYDKAYKKEGMTFFVKLVKDCDGLAFRSLYDGKIPAGVGAEIATIMPHQFVLELPSRVYNRVMGVDETREYLKEIGQR